MSSRVRAVMVEQVALLAEDGATVHHTAAVHDFAGFLLFRAYRDALHPSGLLSRCVLVGLHRALLSLLLDRRGAQLFLSLNHPDNLSFSNCSFFGFAGFRCLGHLETCLVRLVCLRLQLRLRRYGFTALFYQREGPFQQVYGLGHLTGFHEILDPVQRLKQR